MLLNNSCSEGGILVNKNPTRGSNASDYRQGSALTGRRPLFFAAGSGSSAGCSEPSDLLKSGLHLKGRHPAESSIRVNEGEPEDTRTRRQQAVPLAAGPLIPAPLREWCRQGERSSTDVTGSAQPLRNGWQARMAQGLFGAPLPDRQLLRPVDPRFGTPLLHSHITATSSCSHLDSNLQRVSPTPGGPHPI